MAHRFTRLDRLGKALAAAVLAATAISVPVVAATPSPVAAAPTSDQCAGQLAALEAVHEQIDEHNAEPHTFELPDQESQYLAYNAEAAQLNADQTMDEESLQACVEAIEALTDAQPGSPPLREPTPDKVSAINDAKKLIPKNWKPQAPPAPGKIWTVPDGTPQRPLYDALRAGNPATSSIGNATLQGVPRPAIGDPDAAYPGRTIPQNRSRANPGPAVSPDHIIPLAQLINLPGFMDLSAENMFRVANAPVNLQWISKKANDSKSSKSVAWMSGVDPAWQAQQAALERKTLQTLEDTIQKLLKSQKYK